MFKHFSAVDFLKVNWKSEFREYDEASCSKEQVNVKSPKSMNEISFKSQRNMLMLGVYWMGKKRLVDRRN